MARARARYKNNKSVRALVETLASDDKELTINLTVDGQP
jgi:hypothetical protein